MLMPDVQAARGTNRCNDEYSDFGLCRKFYGKWSFEATALVCLVMFLLPFNLSLLVGIHP